MTARPSLPATSSDFALPPSSSSSVASASPFPSDEFNSLVHRFRRPSLLVPPRAGFQAEGRLHSPLASSVTLPLSRRSTGASGEESESDKEKMWTDSPSSMDSGATTPSLSDPSTVSDKSSMNVESDTRTVPSSTKLPSRPSTPPPRRPSSNVPDIPRDAPPQAKSKRLSHPIKIARIQTLLSEESRPEESEVKSEAQFQRLVASCSEQPLQPRTPRNASDRGRYPEEAGQDDPVREDTPSDDDEEADEAAPQYTYASGASEPINIAKPVTPAQSVHGGDDFPGMAESPGGGVAMDVDIPSSYGSPSVSSWRYTPPPTSSAVRSNKRKLDDRYDPYPASKRRAVSPSLAQLRESQLSLFNPRTPGSTPRHPMPFPITIPVATSSGASSPVVASSSLGNGLANSRSISLGTGSVMSSPTLRAQMGLASPVLRPMMRARKEGEREVECAGDGVNGLSLV